MEMDPEITPEEAKEILGTMIPTDISTISTKSEPDDRCPVCGGTGWELIRMPEDFIRGIYGDGYIPDCYYQAAQPCSACTKAGRIARAKAMSSPSLDVTLKDFDWSLYEGHDVEKRRQRVEEFVLCYPRLETASLGGLYISSSLCGTGKTFLAQCICGEMLNLYAVNALCVTMADLLEQSSKKTEDGSDPLGKYIGVRMLILDDLGQKKGAKDWANDVLYRVIDKRYREKRGLIVTSNYDLNELDKYIDRRIVDRINDMVRQVTLPNVPVRRILANRRKLEVMKNLGMEGYGHQ